MRKTIASIAIAATLALGGGLAACSTPDEKTTPAPSAPSTEPTKPVKPNEPAPAEPAKPEDERADMTSLTLDDRSFDGLADIWLVWSITNSSAEKSDYTFDWEAIDGQGNRIGNSTEYVDNVLPDQTVKGEAPTMLEDPNVKINVTSFDRTSSTY